MNNNAQIVPVGTPSIPVDESAEFRALEARVDARKMQEAAKLEASLQEERCKRRETMKVRRRIARNVALMCLGAAATSCAFSAVLAWQSPQPALAFYPAVLGLISAAVGARLRW